MPRKPFTSIFLQRNRRSTLQSQLTAGLRAAIAEGSLKAGDAVPSSRDLASDLGVSRNTVIAAYDQLIGEGYLDARPRSGIFVNEALATPASSPALRLRTAAAPSPKPPPPARLACPLPFRPCQPDVRLFPLALWNRLRNRGIRAHGPGLLHYQSANVLGLPALRRALADYLRDSRGVRCSWLQIAITTGSQQALYLLAQLLTRPAQRVYLEDPGYPGAHDAFRRAGATLRPAPVDAEGLLVPADWESTALLYTTPSRQFPTGACLPVARRLALVERARRARAWIIEDDYDSEFRYSRPPLPSLHSLDPSGQVIYVGTMSKVLIPALRIGYVVLPDSLVESFAALRTVSDEYGPQIDQAALAEFISSGAFYTHIRRCRKVYGDRLGAFLAAARSIDWPLTFPHTDGGMNLAGFLPSPSARPGSSQSDHGEEGPRPDNDDDVEWADVMTRAGLDVPPLSRYCLSAPARGLLFGFTAFDPPAIRAALKRAAAAAAAIASPRRK